MGDLLTEYALKCAQAQQIIQEAIKEELRELIPPLEERKADAQARLDIAFKALESPQAAVKVIDGEILKAENEIQARRTLATSAEMGQRVMANALAQQWENELASLRDKRLEAVSVLAETEADHGKAIAALERCQMELNFIALNLGVPFQWYGKTTKAYRLWINSGGAADILFLRNEEHTAYESAKAWLEDLCHKNEVYPVKTPADKLYRDMWDRMRDDANPADVTTVHNAVAKGPGFEKWDSFDPIEDFRGPGPKDTILNPPPVKDDWRKVPVLDPEHLKRP